MTSARVPGPPLNLRGRLAAWPRSVPFALSVCAFLLFSPFFLAGKVFVPADFLNFILPWRVSGGPGVHNLEQFDTAALFFPLSSFINERLKVGDLPLWDPSVFCGYPLVACGYGVLFYPPRLLAHYLLTPEIAVTLLLFFHTVGSGLGMYGWLRQKSLTPRGAGVGALCWMLNSMSASWLELDLSLMAFYLPLMLWSFDRSQWGLLAIAGGLCINAGHAQMAFYAGWIVAAYALYRIALSRRPSSLVYLILSGIGVVMMSAPTTLPFLELLKTSQRAAFSWPELQRHSASTLSFLATTLNPDLLGNPSRGFMLNRTVSNYPYCEFADYFGLVPLALALYIAFNPRGARCGVSEIRFWSGLAVSALLFAATTPFYRALLVLLPVLSKAIPGRFVFVFLFAGCVLAAHGYEAWEEEIDCRRWVARAVAPVSVLFSLGLTALAIGLSFRAPALGEWLARSLDPAQVKLPPALPPGPEQIRGWLEGLNSAYLFNPQIWMTVAAGPLTWATIRRPRPALLGLFVAADLLLFASHYNTVVDRSSLKPTVPSLGYLQEQPGLFRVDKRGAAFYNTLTPYGLTLVTGYGSVIPQRYLETMAATQGDRTALMRSIDLRDFSSPVLSALNLAYVMQAPIAGLQGPPGWEEVYSGEVKLFRNPRVLPRAYVRGEAVIAADFQQALAHLRSPNFAPEKEVVLESPPPGPVDPKANDAVVTVEQYEPNRVVLSTTLEAPGILVLADTYYPGWVCQERDGRRREIVPANGSSRGVYLEAGEHRLEFRFEPEPFYRGVKLAILGLLLCLAAGAVSWGRGRGRP